MQILVENHHNGIINLSTLVEVRCKMEYFKMKYSMYSLREAKRRFKEYVKKEVAAMYDAKTIEYHRPPTEGNIKFGHGATHYKDFNLIDVLNDEMQIKKWLVCPVDGLRYYY